MQNADDILGGPSVESQGPQNTGQSDPQTNPTNLPSVGTTPGYKTSEGQLTIVFVALAFVFSYFGWNVSQDQIHTGYDMIISLVEKMGPIVSAGLVLWNYITSRGKMKSNAINATAAMAVGLKSGGGFPWGTLLNIGKAVAPALPGTAGRVAGSILGDDVTNSQVGELVSVARNHEGRIKTLEGK